MTKSTIGPFPVENQIEGAKDLSKKVSPIVVRYVEIARRHLWLILAIVVAAVVGGLILTLLATPRYTAETKVEIARQQANVTNVEGIQSEEVGQSLEFYATQYSLLKSRSLAERVSRRLKLASDNAFLEAHGLDKAEEGSTSLAAKKREQKIVDALLANASINPLRGSALVSVAYTSELPDLSARIANAWAAEFVRQSLDRRFASTADAREYLEARLEGLRNRLERSERELVEYAARQGIVRLGVSESEDGQTRVTQTLLSSNLEALSAELVSATAERVAEEGRLNAAQSRRANGAAVANPAINQLRQKHAELSAQYASLLERFEPDYPEAAALSQQIASLNKSIQAEESRIVDSIATNFESSRSREEDLRGRVEGLKGQLDRQNRANIQYGIYQREVDTNRELYAALLQRYKEIGAAGVGTNNISIVDQAIVPDQPSSPNLLLNLALAFIAGLGIAAGAVFVLENIDEGIRQPDDVTAQLGIPLLGVAPKTDGEDPRHLLLQPKSPLAEAYMTIRTTLGFLTDHGAPKSIFVTSTAPAEGKSTTSLALAIMLARTGQKVVLVDADLRFPGLQQALGRTREYGVTNYLTGQRDVGSLIQSTEIPNLSFMASGPIPPSAPDLLNGKALGELVRTLGQNFDHVILDGPPMLGLSDAPLVARTVEGIVFVIESGRVPVRMLAAAVQRVQEARTRIFGAVVTKHQSVKSTTGYDYSYEYGYGIDEAAAPAVAAR